MPWELMVRLPLMNLLLPLCSLVLAMVVLSFYVSSSTEEVNEQATEKKEGIPSVR